jgi:hypothetical protein
MLNKVKVQIGNGTMLHLGKSFELRGRLVTVVECGTKSIRGLTVIELDDTSRFEICERCEAREVAA